MREEERVVGSGGGKRYWSDTGWEESLLFFFLLTLSIESDGESRMREVTHSHSLQSNHIGEKLRDTDFRRRERLRRLREAEILQIHYLVA